MLQRAVVRWKTAHDAVIARPRVSWLNILLPLTSKPGRFVTVIRKGIMRMRWVSSLLANKSGTAEVKLSSKSVLDESFFVSH